MVKYNSSRESGECTETIEDDAKIPISTKESWTPHNNEDFLQDIDQEGGIHFRDYKIGFDEDSKLKYGSITVRRRQAQW